MGIGSASVQSVCAALPQGLQLVFARFPKKGKKITRPFYMAVSTHFPKATTHSHPRQREIRDYITPPALPAA